MALPSDRLPAFVSAAEVARHAGVSRSAVSRAFTQGASVSEATRAKVYAAAEELGYHVNHLARGLMRQKSGIVCLVVSTIPTPYVSGLLDALSRQLQNVGKVGMILNAADADESSVETALRQTLNYRADATIVLSGTPYRSIAQQCLDSGQRLILINREDDLPGTVNLCVDNDKAGRTAANLLLKSGYRRLAVVSSAAGTPSLVGRKASFEAAARSAGAEVTSWSVGPTAYESGLQAGTELMAGEERPDGIFAVTDLLACGVMDAVRHRFGMRVPEDVGIIGFDDIAQAGWSSYNLTTFAQPTAEIAAWAINVIEDAVGDATLDRTFSVPLVWRNSLRPTDIAR